MAFSYGGFKGGGGRLPAGNAQTIASGFIAIHLDLQRLSRQLNYAEQMMKLRMSAAAIRAGQQSGQSFGKKFAGSLRGSLNGVGKMLGRSLRDIGTSAILGGVAFAGFGVKVAAEMEQAEISMQTLLDSMKEGTKLFNEVKSMALETPFEFPELRDAAKLLAIKVPQSSIVPALKMLGDLASGTGGDIKDLAFAYEKIFGSERIQNYWLRMFERRGLPIYAELAKQLKISQQQVFDLAKKGQIGFREVDKALRSMTEAGGAFFQMTDRLATSLLGQYNKLQDSIKEMGRQLGVALTPLVELFTQGAMVMLPKFGKALNDLFSHLTEERVIRWARTFAEALGDLIDRLDDLAYTWASGQAKLAKGAYDLAVLNEDASFGGTREQKDARRELVSGMARDLANRFPELYRLNSTGTRIVDIPRAERKHYTRNKLTGIVDEISQATAAYRAEKSKDEAARAKDQQNRYHDRMMDFWRKGMRSGPYKYTDELNGFMRFFGQKLPGQMGNTLKAQGMGLLQALFAITAGPGADLSKKKKQENIMEGGFTAFEDLNRNIQETLLQQSTDKKIEKNTGKTNILLEAASKKLRDIVVNTSKWGVFVP